MRLVLTVLVRDEADVIDSQIAYHLNAGVDFVIAADHGSRDGTTQILESYARNGHLRLIRKEGPFGENLWRTEMARLAAAEHGADWVIHTDADEFWMPWGGTIKEVFSGIPHSCGVVWALTRPFVPRPDDGTPFFERMTLRLSPMAPINDPTSPYRPHAKVAHRGVPDVTVGYGAHLAHSPTLAPLRDWYPFDVFHFPFRSWRQYERKGVRGVRDNKPLGPYVKALVASSEGRLEDAFGALVVDNEAAERGIRSGVLAVDTRLRDALRRCESAPATSDELDPGSISDRARAVTEGGVLRDADLVRVRRRLDELDARVARIESREPAAPGRNAAA